jgi:DNA transposition AAA+ family ATPase
MSERKDVRRVPFVVTKEHRRFAELCDACRRYGYIGLCYGRAGVGKTLSARHYASWDVVEEIERHDLARLPEMPNIPPPILLSCHTIVYTPSVANTPRSIDRGIAHMRWLRSDLWDRASHSDDADRFVKSPPHPPDPTQLIIVDEADRLKVAGLEQLRDIYDRGAVGLVLIGMPGIEKRLSRYAQLYSRVGFLHQYNALGGEELKYLLERVWGQFGVSFDADEYTTAEAIATVTRITGGNFRLLQRLFDQIERILQINELHLITKEVVEAARQNLVIGTL